MQVHGLDVVYMELIIFIIQHFVWLLGSFYIENREIWLSVVFWILPNYRYCVLAGENRYWPGHRIESKP